MHVRGGGHAAGVNGLHLLGIGEDVGELAREELLFLVGQLELRERRDALDVGDGESVDMNTDGTTRGLKPRATGVRRRQVVRGYV